MRFKEGALGVVVVMVSVALALVGSWALSTDVNDVTVTGYDYVAEITGLFDADQAPEYIEYSPSTNYTGYYTTDPQYFGGVDYVQSTKANQYRLNLAPTATYSDDQYDLSAFDSAATTTFNIRLYVGNGIASKIGTPYSMTLSDLTTAMGYDSYDELIIKNTSAVDWTDQYGQGQWMTFVPDSWIGANPNSSTFADFRMPGNTDIPTGSYQGWTYKTPVLACKYDISTNMVTLYYDIGMNNQAGIFSPTDVWVAWGLDNWTYELDSEVSIDASDYPDVTYMDPTKGVSVE